MTVALGYCTNCHRVRYVRILPDTILIRDVPHGWCTQCEREEEERRTQEASGE